MATQGEGRKRRSFLPAPKKTSVASSPQAPFAEGAPHPLTKTSAVYSADPPCLISSGVSVSVSTCQVGGQIKAPPRPTAGDTSADKQVEALAFGTGLRVGARVRIGGIKPGILRYLGTTHLAPGIFCGIELFDPDGNHDGEVNGHRYFSCSANRGIFAPKEKVCLDPSCSLGRLAVDSDVCYSSTESLSERTNKAFKSFEEGELEAVDCTKLSPILSPQDARFSEHEARARKSRGTCLSEVGDRSTVCPAVDSRRSCLDTQDVNEVSNPKVQPGVPRATQSISVPCVSQSKLPTLSRASKVSEAILFGQRPAVSSGHVGDNFVTSSLESTAKGQCPAFGLDSDQEQERSSPRFRAGSARSSDDSEEDGFLRDTLSTGIKKQLRTDSRQYLNFTFDQEELMQSLGTEDSESDSGFQVFGDVHSTKSLFGDPHFVRDISGDSSDDNLGLSSSQPSRADGVFPHETFMKLEAGVVMLREDSHRTEQVLANSERSSAVKSDSYTISQLNVTRSIDTNASGSEADDGAGLSVTRTISDSDLPPNILPRVGEGQRHVMSRDSLERGDVRRQEHEYTGSDDLNLTRTLYGLHTQSYVIPHVDNNVGPNQSTSYVISDVENNVKLNQSPNYVISPIGNHANVNQSQSYVTSNDENVSHNQFPNYVITHDEFNAGLNQSQSYVVCAHDKRDSAKRERDAAVLASQNHTITRTDSAASSPRRKYRKISTSSSANEGGDSSSSGTEPKTDSSGENRGDNLDDSSTGASPEVSQALEWDYGQEFDGKIPLGHQDSTMTTSTSTGTSESLSDVLRDISEQSDGMFEPDPPSCVTEDSDQFEPPDNEFENIDSLEDFPIFGKDSMTIMTDSGISDKDFDFCPTKSSSSTVCGNSSDEYSREDDASSHATARAISSDSSQETIAAEYVADTPGSVEDKDFLPDDVCSTFHTDDVAGESRRDSFGEGNSMSPASVVSMEDVGAMQDRTLVGEDMHEDCDRHFSSQEDVSSFSDSQATVIPCAQLVRPPDDGATAMDDDCSQGQDGESRGLNKRERPVSLLSTTSADTGYVAGSDSELSTLTSSSPNTDWMDRFGLSHPTLFAPPDMDVVGSDDRCGPGNKLAQPSSSEPIVSTPAAARSNDDDDYSSDLTTNTEDERVEADRVYVPGTTDAAHGVPIELDVPRQDDEGLEDMPGPKDSTDMSSLPTKGSCDGTYEKLSKKEKLAQERKTRARKSTAHTKMRPGNVDSNVPNAKVASRLADQFKALVQVKQKEEGEPKKKLNKNAKNIQKRFSVTETNIKQNQVNSRAPSVDRNNRRESSIEGGSKQVDKSKLAVKRAPPKSKWGNIMSQIEASKDTAKSKPKSEVKSSLAAYLHTPPPATAAIDNTVTVNLAKPEQHANLPKKEFKSKLKPLPPPPPKIDLSKIKSKLNVPTAASAIKAAPKREASPSAANVKNANRASKASPARDAMAHRGREPQQRTSDGNIVLMMRPMAGSAKDSHTDISVCESTDCVMGSPPEEGVPSKRGSVDLCKGDRRHSSQSLRSERPDKSAMRYEQSSHPSRAQVSSRVPAFKPPKKPGVNGAIKVVGNSPRTNSSTTNASQAEVIRLESICEARTKELTHTKMQLRDTAQAFDTMAALLNYCCSDLNAFECPIVTRKLSSAQIQLSDYSCRLDELTLQKDDLNKILNQVIQEKEEALKKVEDTLSLLEKEREEHSKLTHEMDDTHNAALTTQRDELTSKHDETVKKLTQFYDRQIDMLRIAHDRQVSDVKNECKLEMNGVKICHLEEIQELRNKHDSQMEELHKQHRNKLEDITHRFESIKLTLSEKVESLRGECDELARRARVSEEALQRDADAKVQIALAPFISLPKEIDSLKTVLEMRNEEIQKLRTKTMDLEKQLEEIPIARDKIISLQQKVENLEAIINMKTDHEKQLHEKCQVLMRKYDRESRANKRLSMDYEQVMWRMSQSSEFGSSESLTRRHFSRSPPCSEEGSPDMRHRTLSPNCGQSDVVVRVKKRSSQSISEGDRKLRSRSATFVVEKYDSGDSHSPSSSPQLKQKRWRKKSQTDDIVAESRMCHSADAEILSNLPRQKHHGGQNDNLDAKDMAGSVMSCGDMTGSVASSGDMVSSYARSLSGDIANSYTRSLSAVSDSGMYDSMTRSDALDNSMASMDSEWGTSVNLSMNCGPAVDDLESSPPARNYHSLNVTVMPERHPSETDSGNVSCVTSSHEGSSNYQADIESIAGTKVQAEDQKNNGSYQFYITLPDEQALTDDSVFDKPIESGSL